MRNIEDYTQKYLAAPFLKENVYYRRKCVLEQMSKMLEYQIINNDVLEGLWNLTKYFPENGSEIYVNIKKRN